jgi:lipopolysaccharide biosynthesis glycosyltransferase
MNINFLHVGQDVTLPTRMVESVLATHKGANIIQLTDESTPIIKGVSSVVRKPYNGQIMLFRMQHLADLRGEWITIDTDMIVKKDLSHVFDKDFDVALTRRYGVILDANGTDIVKEMPYNCGLMFSRNHEFWKDCLKLMNVMTDDLKQWWGDQVAVKAMADSYDVLELDCAEYNYTPKNADERKDVYVYHFKGQRKAWMMNGIY